MRKENKDFTRVGWILDYRLRFQEEEGRAGGKNKDNFGQGNNIDRKELRIDLVKDKEVRVDLMRNAPDKRGWTTHETNHVILKKNLNGKRSNSKHLRQDSLPERRRG